MPGPDTTQPGETAPGRDDRTAPYRGPVPGEPPRTGDFTTATADPGSDPLPDRPPTARFGRYEVLAPLGRGGFGTVYAGHDPLLGRRVAIKVPTRGRSGAELDALLKEARRLAQLRHPGILTVYDVGVEDGLCYIVTDLLAGQSLADAMKARRFPWGEAVRLAAGVADALAHAHSLSLVHRDVKPGNIFLTPAGDPILLDFGLARTDIEAAWVPGLIAGTPAYMAPEQAQGQGHRVDGRTDVYGLGVVLYHLLCGRVPFRSDDTAELFRKVIDDDPQPPRQLAPDLPPALEQVCLKAMAKRMADRFTTAGDFAAALRAVLPAVPGTTPAAPPATDPAADDSTRRVDVGSSSVRRRRGAERRRVTVVAILAEPGGAADPEAQLELTRTVRDWLDDAAAEFGGAVLPGSGPELAACFGFPVAREDAAPRAVRAARAVVARAAAIAAVSAVVHTGEVVAEEDPARDGQVTLAGDVAPAAARLAVLVEPGQVAVTDAALALVRGYFETTPLGPHRVRGTNRPVELFRVDREVGGRNRVELVDPGNLTPLIGRDTEISVLADRWERAAEGVGQLVLLVGDAGLGKSRLIRELRERVAAADGAGGVVEWRCAADSQDTGFFPAVAFVERLLGFTRADAPGERLGRIAGHLGGLGLGGAENVALVANLLGLPPDDRFPPLPLTPQRQKERTLDLILDCLRASAAPLLFVVEDLHWADPSTLELLARYAAEADGHPGLAVWTFRPEFRPPWREPANQTRIALARLTKRQIGEMMARRLGRADVPAAVVAQVADRTDGVPLFVEEFTTLVKESGLLDRPAADDSVELRVIPATLQDLLLARLDRMASDPAVVQLAAALGREFDHDLFAAAADLPAAALQAELDKLVGAEVLFRKGRPPKCSYSFKHALLQDAAYGSLVRGTRQQFHRRIAEVLERDFPETARTRPELLARHYTEAGDVPKAIDYWLAAGLHAQAGFANAEAVRHLTRGLELIAGQSESPDRDARELRFQVPRAVVLMTSRGYAHPDLEAVHARARELCERLGPAAPLFHVVWGNWALRLIRDELDTALTLADELLDLATRRGDRGLQMEAWFAAAITKLYRGDFPGSRAACRACAALEDEARCVAESKHTGQNAGMAYRCYDALSAWHLGYPDEARRRMPGAIAHARKVSHAFSLAYALHHAGWLAYLCRHGDEGIRLGDECVAVSQEQGFAFWKALGIINRGTGHMVAGRPADALRHVEEGLALYDATGSRKSLAEYHGFLAEIHRQAGRPADALREADAGLGHCGRTNNRVYEAELHRVRGEALLARHPDDPAGAEACFHQSLAVARRQEARSWELRGAMSLARLWRANGRAAEARDLLAGVYGWFTEGFDTPDLLAAKALLAALNQTVSP